MSITSLLKSATYYFQDDKIVMQFIPMLLLVFYGFYSNEFVVLSQSVLGKLFAVIAIMYYAKMNKTMGVIACLLIVLYYQEVGGSSLIKSYLTQTGVEGFDGCVNGQLMHQGIPVKKDMAAHVFSEIESTDYPCNPCDPGCGAKHPSANMSVQEELMHPKVSRDYMTVIRDYLMGDRKENFVPNPASTAM